MILFCLQDLNSVRWFVLKDLTANTGAGQPSVRIVQMMCVWGSKFEAC